MAQPFYTYLLASAPYGTLYCGHTDSLVVRIGKHRDKTYRGFTAEYGVSRLVWYESHGERGGAFRRERQIKRWNRAWKIRLIEETNPTWADLYDDLINWLPDGVTPLAPHTPAHPREGGDPS